MKNSIHRGKRIALALLLGIGYCVIANASCQQQRQGVPSQSPEQRCQVVSSSPHGPISINGDSALVAFVNKTGNGTAGDPFIIRDLVINATGYSYGIQIANTASYLIIVNCSVASASSIGISISDSLHVTIMNCTITQSYEGIRVWEEITSDVIITRCLIKNNIWCGIGLYVMGVADYTSYTISDSKIALNGQLGIYILGPAQIMNNTITNHTTYGLQLYGGTFFVSNNVVRFNNASGISLNYVYGTTLVGNTITENRAWGMVMNSSSNGIYMGNDFRGNGNGSILATYSIGNLFRDNLFDPGQDLNNQHPELGAITLYASVGTIAIVPPVLAFVLYKTIKHRSRRARSQTPSNIPKRADQP
jgi:parallel beta-helix repeat protein